MNGTDRLERELTSWFADTAAPKTPDWTADILAATSTVRQRPRWSFPTRWLPAAVVPRLPRLTLQPVPWRTIALLALLGLLLATAVTLYVGSRPRLPSPFGPAVNGLVAYAERGDIWTVDPVTGMREAIVTLPGADLAPHWSRDGTRLAFLRQDVGGDLLAITKADGSRMVVSKGAPFLDADTDSIVWSPNGDWVAVVANSGLGRTTYLVDTATGVVKDLHTPAIDVEPYWRPPDGRQLMYVRTTGAGPQPMLVPSAGGVGIEMDDPDPNLRPGGWTPDGRYFVLHRYDAGTDRAWTELLDPETGTTSRHEVGYGRVSNDGKLMVGHRMFPGDAEPALCVMPLPGGPCARIADPRFTPEFDHTAGLQWSPDDRWIVAYPQDENIGWVLLSPEGGPAITPIWSERGVESWQRKAP